ncbi:unnamed protein product [Prorocentrum cordatum]|uniref:Selenoprotein O n=1 Tax=Prorocentrum cordatum TaxID=2364126 RepID=A0ABN9TPR3_9DINO|nr:unnamed protein product [Polarella glacialis]
MTIVLASSVSPWSSSLPSLEEGLFASARTGTAIRTRVGDVQVSIRRCHPTRFKDFQAASPSEGAGLGARRGPRPPHSPSGERARGRSSRRPGAAPARARAVLDPFYSGGPGRGAPRLPPGCPWVCLRFRRCCHGERDAPTPPLGKRPGVSGSGTTDAASRTAPLRRGPSWHVDGVGRLPYGGARGRFYSRGALRRRGSRGRCRGTRALRL